MGQLTVIFLMKPGAPNNGIQRTRHHDSLGLIDSLARG